MILLIKLRKQFELIVRYLYSLTVTFFILEKCCKNYKTVDSYETLRNLTQKIRITLDFFRNILLNFALLPYIHQYLSRILTYLECSTDVSLFTAMLLLNG